MLIRFKVSNHRSLRDEMVLDLARPTLRTLKPAPDERWADHVYPVAGIFGANASGKTSVLDALHYAIAAVRHSSGGWLGRTAMPREPFLLDHEWRRQPSTYDLDFVHSDRRYRYEFGVDDKGITHEQLRDLPSTRWRTLLRRDAPQSTAKLHSSLSAIGPVAGRELVLSRAAMLDHAVLAPIAQGLNEFDFTEVSYADRERRLHVITDAIAEGSIDLADVRSLLRMADVGIENVEVHEAALSDDLREVLALMQKKGMQIDIGQAPAVGRADEGQEPEEPETAAILDENQSDEVVRNLLFTHAGADPTVKLDIRRESDGTLAWLALSVPALETLRFGGVYCIDEIDSSLHPHLVELLVAAFADPEVNRRGGQLILTSHESFLLSNLSDLELQPEQVWFAEKARDGATTVFSLADFPRHKDANHAKRYLLGRYGATPRLAPSAFGKLVDAGAR